MNIENRDSWIDRIKVSLVALVVFHHTAMIYGGPGGWYYQELTASDGFTALILTFFFIINQSYFMSLFFLISGYYTPGSLEKRGYRKFVLNRALRLGLPILIFVFVLGPISIGMGTIDSTLFSTLRELWNNRNFINGPIWFLEVLLVFSLIYCGLRYLRLKYYPPTNNSPRPIAIPSFSSWFGSALCLGFATCGVRHWVGSINNREFWLTSLSSFVFFFT